MKKPISIQIHCLWLHAKCSLLIKLFIYYFINLNVLILINFYLGKLVSFFTGFDKYLQPHMFFKFTHSIFMMTPTNFKNINHYNNEF